MTGEISDHSAFFRDVPLLLPEDARLVLEGGRHPDPLRSFIARHEVPADQKIAIGTVWPRQAVHHLPATRALLHELAQITEHCASPEVCDHLHAYLGGDLLLQWFDAFSAPLFVSKLVPEERLKEFATALGIEYDEQKA